MSYHSVFIIIKSTILSCMSHFEQEKGNKHVMQHRNTHSGLFLLKRERNKHHSDQWKRNHTWKQEDGLSIQHRLSHVTEEKQKLMWTPDKTAVSNKNLKPAPTHFCSVQNLNCISIIWIKVAIRWNKPLHGLLNCEMLVHLNTKHIMHTCSQTTASC